MERPGKPGEQDLQWAISDSGGKVVWAKRYRPFGGEAAQSGTLENDYQFAGKGFDAEANLYYFNARWYDAEIGRFISEDPVWGNIRDPQSLNRFAYGRNNPFRYTDPSGRLSFDDLYDPDNRSYSVNKDTGEIRYGDSGREGDSDGVHVVGDTWSSWISPYDNASPGEDSVADIERQYRDESLIKGAMEELREFLESGGIQGLKNEHKENSFTSRVAIGAVKAGAGGTLWYTGLQVVIYSTPAFGIPGVGWVGGAVCYSVGGFMMGTGAFLMVDSFYDIVPGL